MLELLQSAPPALRQLLVCQLLSRPGQRAMLTVERDYLVDVPLGLAQLITSGYANQLVSMTVLPSGGNINGEEQGEEHLMTVSDGQTVSTLALSCRLLLQGTRLEELLQVRV